MGHNDMVSQIGGSRWYVKYFSGVNIFQKLIFVRDELTPGVNIGQGEYFAWLNIF